MPYRLRALPLAFKAFWQLGPAASLRFAAYQAAVRLGLYRLLTPANRPPEVTELRPLPLTWPKAAALKAALGPEGERTLLAEADEILAGQVCLFGGPPVPLELAPPSPLWHWSYYKMPRIGGRDIKLLWEPARFGWAITLGRAYRLTGHEKYAEEFWLRTESFLTANPVNQGPNWASAQEVGLRLIAMAIAASLFWASPETTSARQRRLGAALAAHARRIPPTLLYARAQNNNHLLTEAAGLLTAAAVLPGHPQARRWARLGRGEFGRGLRTQISPQGAYAQHSANYHRLLLQIGLWVQRLAESGPDPLTPASRACLAAASEWLAALLDPETGTPPNLGPNDGALILPFTTQPFADFRPAVHAARRAFTGADLPPDEMALWLAPVVSGAPSGVISPHLKLTSGHAWGGLRAARYTSRPGHADPLHFDLWWRGQYISRDPGSGFYNAKPPWENPLTGAEVHNTLTLNGQQPMTRAGKFLWLDWAQSDALEHSATRLAARHNGYRRLGLAHTRTVEAAGAVWRIMDEVQPTGRRAPADAALRLHWLLPDWPWELEGATLTLASPHGPVSIVVSGGGNLQPSLARAGELLAGAADVLPARGWFSPTYTVLEPALSFAIEVQSPLPATLTTTFTLPV